MVFLLSVFLLILSSCYTELDSSPEWTAMLYIAADNNLFAHAEHTLIRAAQGVVDQDKRFNLLIMCDGRNKENVNDIGEAAYYILEKDGLTRIKDLGQYNSGDTVSHTDFIDYGIRHFPAKKYCMIFWGHTSGIDRFVSDNGGISRDEGAHVGLKVKELVDVIKYGKERLNKKIDVVGLDACSLMYAEVAYEMKDYVNYLCGSQDTQNAFSWDYQSLVSTLWKRPHMDARELCIAIGKGYQFFYEDIVPEYKIAEGGVNQDRSNDTFSAVDLNEIINLRTKFHILSKDLTTFIEGNSQEFATNIIERAMVPSRIYKDISSPMLVINTGGYNRGIGLDFAIDIKGFAERAKKEITDDNPNSGLITKCDDVITAFDNAIIFGYSRVDKDEDNRPNGLSIRDTYPGILSNNNVDQYIEYEFNKKHGQEESNFVWARLIKAAYDKAQVEHFRAHNAGQSKEELASTIQN